jgi:RNA polymerase sigma-70 factor (ECF subfamily)
MADPLAEAVPWLPAARAGSREALGHLFEACRGYLLLIARQELDPALRAKGSASDLVQQTFLEAQNDLPRFHGTTPEALRAWMRRLLLNNLANFRRDHGRQKRRASREVSLSAGDSSALCAGALCAAAPSPSSALMRDEQTEALERAVSRLSPDHRQVIQFRYREEKSFEEIAGLMRRSPNAVRKLWARAVESLQHELESPP